MHCSGGNFSKKIKVLLSGGRENFYPNDTTDVEYKTRMEGDWMVVTLYR